MALKKIELHQSFLLNQFNEFYESVIHHKERIRLRRFPGTDEEKAPAVDPEFSAADPIYHKLIQHLEKQVVDARSRGGEYGVAYYREAQYVMAALADETFIHMDWEGRQSWKSNLLEVRLFGTHDAGERIFNKIDVLLKANDPGDAEMAAIYLQALSLGFRGKFRDTDDKGMIAFYHRELFKIIFQRHPDLTNEKRLMLAEPYAHTLDHGEKRKIPYFRWWGAMAVLLILAFLATSHGVWQYLTGDIQHVVEKIIQEFRVHQ